MIAIIDYDAGNIRSVENALLSLGMENVVTDDPDVIRSADRVILPGVGAFGDAMKKLADRGLTEVIREVAAERPFLGICLGLQLLFEESEETPGRLERPSLPEGVEAVCGRSGRKLRLFRPFLLSAGGMCGGCGGHHGVRRDHPCGSQPREAVRVPVPSREER